MLCSELLHLSVWDIKYRKEGKKEISFSWDVGFNTGTHDIIHLLVDILCSTRWLFFSVCFHKEHNIYCSALSICTTCLPLCVSDAVAVSHVKVLNSETETGESLSSDFLFAEQHCHLVLNRDGPAHLEKESKWELEGFKHIMDIFLPYMIYLALFVDYTGPWHYVLLSLCFICSFLSLFLDCLILFVF